MYSNSPRRRVHDPEFKARILSECRQPGASVSAVAIAHGLNTNVVHKWLAGHGLKRMKLAAAARPLPAVQFVPVELTRPTPVAPTAPEASADIRMELQRAGLHVKLHCPSGAVALYAAQLRALADSLCVA